MSSQSVTWCFIYVQSISNLMFHLCPVNQYGYRRVRTPTEEEQMFTSLAIQNAKNDQLTLKGSEQKCYTKVQNSNHHFQTVLLKPNVQINLFFYVSDCRLITEDVNCCLAWCHHITDYHKNKPVCLSVNMINMQRTYFSIFSM